MCDALACEYERARAGPARGRAVRLRAPAAPARGLAAGADRRRRAACSRPPAADERLVGVAPGARDRRDVRGPGRRRGLVARAAAGRRGGLAASSADGLRREAGERTRRAAPRRRAVRLAVRGRRGPRGCSPTGEIAACCRDARAARRGLGLPAGQRARRHDRGRRRRLGAPDARAQPAPGPARPGEAREQLGRRLRRAASSGAATPTTGASCAATRTCTRPARTGRSRPGRRTSTRSSRRTARRTPARFVAINVEQRTRAVDRDAARDALADRRAVPRRRPRRARRARPAARATPAPTPSCAPSAPPRRAAGRWRWLAPRPRATPRELPLEWAAGAVCDAYVALGELPAEVAATLRVHRPAGGLGARRACPTPTPRSSRRVSAALDELFGGGALPRYVVSRKVAAAGRPADDRLAPGAGRPRAPQGPRARRSTPRGSAGGRGRARLLPRRRRARPRAGGAGVAPSRPLETQRRRIWR